MAEEADGRAAGPALLWHRDWAGLVFTEPGPALSPLWCRSASSTACTRAKPPRVSEGTRMETPSRYPRARRPGVGEVRPAAPPGPGRTRTEQRPRRIGGKGRAADISPLLSPERHLPIQPRTTAGAWWPLGRRSPAQPTRRPRPRPAAARSGARGRGLRASRRRACPAGAESPRGSGLGRLESERGEDGTEGGMGREVHRADH